MEEIEEIKVEEETYIEGLINQSDKYLANAIRFIKGMLSTESEIENEIKTEQINEEVPLKNSEIKINYTYNFTITIANEGILTINNNARYPKIKQAFANVKSQGGISEIVKNAKYRMNTDGMTLNGISFPKTGTIAPIYKGNIKVVNL